MRKAFTLLEVNLAILVMAGGILSIVVFFSLGYRESSQSREDVASAAYADRVLGPLVMGLSQLDLKWDDFDNLDNLPDDDGWGYYMDDNTGRVKSGAKSTAQTVYSKVMSIAQKGGNKGNLSSALPDMNGMTPGLVVRHDKGSGLVKIAFRASRKESTLLSAPLYYTEVRFQGKQKED